METKKKVKKMAFGGMMGQAAGKGMGTLGSMIGLSKPAPAKAAPAPAAKAAPAPAAKTTAAKAAPTPPPKGMIGQGAAMARAAMGAKPLFRKNGGTVAAKTKTRAKGKK